MATVTIELPSQASQTEFNLRRWAELLKDREYANFEGRIETDRFGRVIMSPPPAYSHGGYQLKIGSLLAQLMPNGRASAESPVSTADGVKGADITWASAKFVQEFGDQVCLPKAPELCVEVLSPDNSKAEIAEKMALYFDAGAKEVWVCSKTGAMTFHGPGGVVLSRSELCPDFPTQLRLV